MKYKVGDRVLIKSIDWYNENKDEYGYIDCGSREFFTQMSDLCGKIATIKEICKTNCYHLEEYDFEWTDEMIEGLVEEENNKEDISWMYHGKLVAERFSDGANIKQPKYNKISINTEFCDNKVELAISPDFELKQEGDKWFAVKKKKEYPKTYKECCGIIGFCSNTSKWDNPFNINRDTHPYIKHLDNLMESFCKLIICRDAYWKLYGEEKGLGKPWEPDWKKQDKKYIISVFNDTVIYFENETYNRNAVLSFPTEEMRDAFYENFKELIEECKELL